MVLESKGNVVTKGSTEYIYAEEYNAKNDNTEDKTSELSNKYIIVVWQYKEALVKKV